MQDLPRKMPPSLMAIQGAGTVLILAGALLWYVAKPPPSGAPRLFEVLILLGVVCYFVFAFRCWQWIKRGRSAERAES